MPVVRRWFHTSSILAAVGLLVVSFFLHRNRESASPPTIEPEIIRGTTSAVHLANAHPGATNSGTALSLFPSLPVQNATPVAADAATRARVVAGYGKLPLQFESDKGQTDKRVKFLSRGRGYTMFLTDKAEAVLCLSSPQRARRDVERSLRPRSLPSSPTHRKTVGGKDGDIPLQPPSVVRMKLVNANPAPKVTGGEELPGKVNYFLGNDPKKWRTNVATYEKVEYESVYPGVDLVYYGNQQGRLEHDFIVAPGADPKQIAFQIMSHERKRLAKRTNVPPTSGRDAKPGGLQAGSHVEGATSNQSLTLMAHPPVITPSGDLVIHTDAGDVQFQKPIAYQETDQGRKEVFARYALLPLPAGEGRGEGVRFVVADYDKSLPLIIDPVLSYSTYLGGNSYDHGVNIAVDSSGNAYVTGLADSTNFPTANPLQGVNRGYYDAFVAKLNAAGSALVYSTYLGGSSEDWGCGIAVDGSGNAGDGELGQGRAAVSKLRALLMFPPSAFILHPSAFIRSSGCFFR